MRGEPCGNLFSIHYSVTRFGRLFRYGTSGFEVSYPAHEYQFRHYTQSLLSFRRVLADDRFARNRQSAGQKYGTVAVPLLSNARKSARRVETSIIDGQAGIQVCVVRLFRGGEPVLRILFLLYHPAVYNSFRRIFPRIVPHDARFALIWNNAGFRDYSADRSAASVHGDYGLFPVSDG